MDQILIGIKQSESIYFDDSVELIQHQPVKLKLIKIFLTNDALLGIQANYYSFKTQKTIKCLKHRHTKLFGVRSMKLALQDDEYIINVEGNYSEKTIHRLSFKTNKDQSFQVGINQGQSFDFKVPQDYQITTFSGGINKSLSYLYVQMIPLSHEKRDNLQLNQIYNWQNYQKFLKWMSDNKSQEIEDQQEQKLNQNQNINYFEQIPSQVQVCEPRSVQKTSDYAIQQTIESALKISKYVQFRIKILNNEGEIYSSCYRRYKDFAQYRELLVQKWPGIYIPPIPNKEALKEKDSIYIESRRKYLEYFLIKISFIPFFTDTVEYGLFTERGKKQEENIQQVYLKLKDMTKPATKEQIKLRYLQMFNSFNQTTPVNELQRIKVNEFYAFLQRSLQTFDLLVQDHINHKIVQSTQLTKLFEKQSQSQFRISKQILPDFQQLYVKDLSSLQVDPKIQVHRIELNVDRRKSQVITNNLQQEEQQQTDSSIPIIQWDPEDVRNINEFYCLEQKEIQTYINCLQYIKSLEVQRLKIENGLLTSKSSDEEICKMKNDLQTTTIIWSILVKIFCEYYIDKQYIY